MKASREQQVLALLRADPLVSQQRIAEQLGISRSAVAGHIMKLTNKGIIKGRAYVISDEPFVAVIGGVNMDIHGKPERALRQADSNVGTVTTSPGGVARNIAENLARLGTNCRLVSAVGNDSYGRSILEECRDAGVDVQHVSILDNFPTSTYLSVLNAAGDMQVAINDMAIIDELNPQRLSLLEATLKRAALVVVDTNLSDTSLAWLADHLQEQALFVDAVSTVKSIKIKPFLASVHTLKTNRDEAEAISGLSARTVADRKHLAAWFHKKGVLRLFVTLGKNGVFYSDGEQSGTLRSKNERPQLRSTGGAGDAFMAGIAYAWLQHWPVEKSLQFALTAAEVTLADDKSSSAAISLGAINQICEQRYAG